MLTLTYLRERRDSVISSLAKRGLDVTGSVDRILELDASRRGIQKDLDDTLAESNVLSRKIGELMREGKREEAEGVKSATSGLKEKTGTLRDKMSSLENEVHELLSHLPNTPSDMVVAGKSAEDNEEVGSWGEKPDLGDHNKPHWDIAKEKDLIDFELGSKVTGAGFPFYKGKGAKLQRGLIRFFLDYADDAGYTEYIPPLMINAESGFGTGQLPDKEGQMYHMPVDDLYMIPTAEVPLTNIYRDTMVNASDFPIKLCGYTPCFRREAGSYGKDVRGLNRLHQFDKVEIVQIQHPDKSAETLDSMVDHVKGLLEALELPYRILRLCAGDMGFTAAMTYDFEVWSAAQERWLEVSSVSNFETFQSNRLKCRFKGADGKNQLVHTLNGSALALPRIVAALLENHQDADGVKMPKALVPYVGFDRI
ncbi:MAG TPA: serine--tRNA ligase [Flavobacteriales bacterium]|nr:serine--tRNA ligase [Flavobacteriales bacterium]HIO16034.1 serine--tRNA ligase [Flavobacteriales bacterium]HIO59723.1 serine--tRNA ligase [Flavobacteriales bacterium]